ncbi:ATP-binding protein [Streptomyces hawaiiensis]|jgi:anti-sigma regulatory factor (Ser/Thr protein kinase)|uniref:ATP-binding protein n=1 Tax=Streptomyces hawaiiensis TaxID=67305 RepID=A0A6G5RSX7_9ACTN|nr:ATP-binding protein [Streptomyces hawaiiensis]QCD60964.1 ATP-binding protein [Streptomyces hawaiiensis]
MYVTDTGRTSDHGARHAEEGVRRLAEQFRHPGAADVIRPLDHSAEAVATARRMVEGLLGRLKVAEVDTVVLVVSELVTNAIEHALPPLALHLRRDPIAQQVWVGVSDGGPASHHGPWTTSCTDDEHGRGLGIVEALTDGQGTLIRADGMATHWVTVST